jgi:hypothetical protein
VEDFLLRVFPARHEETARTGWFFERRQPTGEITLSVARDGSGYLLRFPELADFVLSPDAREIRCYPLTTTPALTLRHLFLDQVLPLALGHRRKIVLHASSVAGPEGAIAFLGESGLGKSTLTAEFAKHGCRILTDDCLLIEHAGDRLLAIPSYPSLRLWPDVVAALFQSDADLVPLAHYTDKKRLRIQRVQRPLEGTLPSVPAAFGTEPIPDAEPAFSREPVPLHRVYLLQARDEEEAPRAIAIEALSPKETFVALISHTFKLDIKDRRTLLEDFQALTSLAARPLFHRLSFPRDLSLVSAVRRAVLAHVDDP